MTKKQDSLADILGKGYAHVQHGIDRLIGWGFKKMKESEPKPTETSNRVVKAGKEALSFIGRAGDAYFQEYDALKKEQKDD